MDDGTKGVLVLCGIASVIGELTGLGLSFTALSPLVIGGIIAAIPVILLAAFLICNSVKKGEFSKKDLFGSACLCVTSAAIGVGLAAAATAIFPGAMLGLGSAALAGATIGVIAPIAGIFATVATLLAAEKVNEYIISPIVERIFPSKGEGYE
ncbi:MULTISPECIES: hypothetical protein [Wolbachia]|uniref:Uncharacterized protein n=1 Tax=Wolbachia pipientis TaxID=955 RepID=A0A7G5CCT5_WOLPI|nr:MULTISPECIES: hypothetical protein [Wolbachia]MDE5061417.1 hypothetical protein [Wolbachia endosymbiont of Drosophila nikananu]QMV47019.1 hypothetical protein HC356_02980 [Wolbachia pipientis]